LRSEVRTCVERGVRLQVIGRRDRLPARVVAAVEAAEAETAGGGTLRLRIALDYSARDAIVAAACGAAGYGSASGSAGGSKAGCGAATGGPASEGPASGGALDRE